MSAVLREILAHKAQENAERGACPFTRERPVHNPLPSLREHPFIAEIKRASPSAGVINAGVDVVAQARSYRQFGAGAISVLTDKRYFQGDFAILRQVGASVELPLLCKDFIISEGQIDWAYAAGADLVLLLAAALSPERLKCLYDYARALGLQVLLEVHHRDELEGALALSPEILGVNSRDLRRMCIDKEAAVKVLRQVPSSVPVRVAESGIEGGADVGLFAAAGANAFLVGSHLMRSRDLRACFAQLYRGLDARET